MKKLTFEEFNNRLIQVAKARQIFIPNITDNISIAFELYQEILADEEKGERMAVFIPSSAGKKEPSPFDDLERLKCPECGTEMMLAVGVIDTDGNRRNSSWKCRECLYEEYSDKTFDEWVEELNNGKQ